MMPRSATPSPTNSTTSAVRTDRRSSVDVLDARDEAPVALLEDEPGVVQQRQRGLHQPTLVRDGEGQPSRVSDPARGPGEGRRAGSPLRSSESVAALAVVEPEAIRVIVAVLAPVRG